MLPHRKCNNRRLRVSGRENKASKVEHLQFIVFFLSLALPVSLCFARIWLGIRSYSTLNRTLFLQDYGIHRNLHLRSRRHRRALAHQLYLRAGNTVIISSGAHTASWVSVYETRRYDSRAWQQEEHYSIPLSILSIIYRFVNVLSMIMNARIKHTAWRLTTHCMFSVRSQISTAAEPH